MEESEVPDPEIAVLKWRPVKEPGDFSSVSSAYRANKVSFQHLESGDPVTRRIFDRARKVAATDLPVMVVGETGTGKNLLAQAIHNLSGAGGDFIAVGPADLPATLADSVLFGHSKGSFTGAHKDHLGLFDSAENGTLFLDELLELDLNLQAKLLGVVEYRKYRPVGVVDEKRTNARLVVGIQGDPDKAVEDGKLRGDLYYRLKGAVFRLPPLRERAGDAVALGQKFVLQAAKRLGKEAPTLSEESKAAIAAYSWPGNLRELKRVIQVAVLDAEQGLIGVEHLGLDSGGSPLAADGDGPASLRKQDLEEWALRKALEMTGGSKRLAAKELGISEATLYRSIRRLGIE